MVLQGTPQSLKLVWLSSASVHTSIGSGLFLGKAGIGAKKDFGASRLSLPF